MTVANRPVACAVFGASGRMGRSIVDIAGSSTDVELAAAWVGSASSQLGETVQPGMPSLRYSILGQAGCKPDVVIDFSRADAFDDVLDWCRTNGVALVSGTTGLSEAQRVALAAAATRIPVLWSANFSLGVAVLERVIAQTVRVLPDWDVEIIEAHHAGKRDVPSGTAVSLGRIIAAARGQRFEDVAVFERHGADEPRRAGQIGFAAFRAGDIVGEHTVVLAGAGERLELAHRASDRGIFAHGALHAAQWLVRQPPGVYDLQACLDTVT